MGVLYFKSKFKNKERFGIHTFQAFWKYIIAHSALNYLTIKKINLYNGAASWTFAVRSASDSRELIQEASLVRANKQKKVTSSFDLHSETINMLRIKILLEQSKIPNRSEIIVANQNVIQLSKQCLTIVEINTKQLHALFRVWKHDILTKNQFQDKLLQTQTGVRKDLGQEEYPSARRDEAQSKG